MSNQEKLAAAWVAFIAAQAPSHAVTLCYNNRYGGTKLPCYLELEDGRLRMLPQSGWVGPVGKYQLPYVRKVTLDQIANDVRMLHGTLDRNFFGSRYHKLPPERRSECVGFVEHLDTNAHVHLAWRVPESISAMFTAELKALWTERVSFGSVKIEDVRDDGWSKYISKRKHDISFGDAQLFVASLAKRIDHS